MSVTSDIPITLVEQIEADKCVVLVGPEASIPAMDRLGPPGSAMLAAELALRLGRPLDYYALPWVAQVYADGMGSHALCDYVAKRLDDPRYCPTAVHHLIAQLPFRVIVYTTQDDLLRQALQQHRVQASYVLQDASLSYGPGRMVIQLYGAATQPDTLRLTEDARRQVFDDNSDVARFLRDRADTHSLLFLGYALNDPTFREFYHDLRPQIKPHAPRAYLLHPLGGEDESGYWQGRNAGIIPREPQDFLRLLADVLAERGKIPVSIEAWQAEPPLLTAEEQAQREKLFVALSRQMGAGGPVESGMQLQPVANNLAFVRRVGQEMAGQSGHLDEEDLPAQVLLQQGNAAWAEGNHQKAREFFEQAIDRNPELIDARFSLYYLLVETGELAEAAGVYRQILVRAPGRAFLPERYQIQQILGQSEIGITYCVLDIEQNQTVAVTILRRTLALQPEVAERFTAEMAPVVSKRISRVLSFDRYRLRSYLITELVEGPTLQDRLSAGRPLPLPEAWRITDEVAEALQAGEREGVPHLALSPGNIILSQEGVKLVSYGFSRLTRASHTAAAMVIQPRTDYQSPEQRAGEAGDGSSDIYALGTILYEMLAGRPPGVGAFEEISQVRPQVGEVVDLLVARARAVDPKQRFRSITEMRQEIQRISLATQVAPPGRSFRMALAQLSDLYAFLVSGHGGLIVLLLLLAFALAEAWTPLAGLRGLSRGVFLLLVNSLVTSVIAYYIIRETARRQGFGSLVRSGRAMGASLGWCLTFLVLTGTRWLSPGGLRGVRWNFFGAYAFAHLAVILVFFGLCLALIVGAAALAGKWGRRYVWGFYGSYLAVSALLILASAFRLIPPGLLKVA